MNTKILTAVVVGILGAGVVGYALGSSQNSFSDDQRQYITGVAQGGKFSVDEPTAHDRCIKEYYPDELISLSGCLEVLDEGHWVLP